MLPKVSIKYLNGLLGTLPESQDGLLALALIGAAPVDSTFLSGRPYKIYGEASLDALGVTEENNARLVELVRQFYAEASEGTPLYIVGYNTSSMAAFCTKSTGSITRLVEELKGDIRGVVVAVAASDGDYEGEGLYADVINSVPLAQESAEYCAESLYAPIFILLEGAGYQDAAALPDMSKEMHDRVAVVLGDTENTGEHAAVGLVAGRIAAVPIQRNIAAVSVGPLAAQSLYLGGDLVDKVMDDVRTINDKGYIVPRIHVGRSGYFYADDPMCCDPTKDYAHLTARRTVDKAARIAYDTLIDFLLSEIEINEDGTMQTAVVKSWQAAVESAIDTQMAGELSTVAGSGCKCVIDASQNVLATSQINVVLKVRPYGYAREIVCELGFLTTKA